MNRYTGGLDVTPPARHLPMKQYEIDEGVIQEEDDVLMEDEPGTGGSGTTDTPDNMDSGNGGSGMDDSLNEGGNSTTTPLPDDTGGNAQDSSNPDSIR